MNESGYLISVFLLVSFACLTRTSLNDLVALQLDKNREWSEGGAGSMDYAVLEVDMTEKKQHRLINGFESLGHAAYGQKGQIAVIISKMCYAWGCLVAYIVVLKNNMPSGLVDLFGVPRTSHNIFYKMMNNTELLTLLLAMTFILPLCLFRKADKLAKFSFLR